MDRKCLVAGSAVILPSGRLAVVKSVGSQSVCVAYADDREEVVLTREFANDLRRVPRSLVPEPATAVANRVGYTVRCGAREETCHTLHLARARSQAAVG